MSEWYFLPDGLGWSWGFYGEVMALEGKEGRKGGREGGRKEGREEVREGEREGGREGGI